jgi:hypothetical protein
VNEQDERPICLLCLDGAGLAHNGAYTILSTMGRDGEFHEQLEPCGCACHAGLALLSKSVSEREEGTE